MRAIDADSLVALVKDSTILGDGFVQAFVAIVNGEPTVDTTREYRRGYHDGKKRGKQPEQRWIPCKMVNQCYIPSLKDMSYGQVLITYLSGKEKKPQVTSAWIERGRTLNKKYNNVIAWMPLPEPWKGDGDA